MAKRKNSLSIDFSAFSEYAEKLDELNADLKSVFSQAMEKAGKQVADDTVRAVGAANLPADGQYSTGETEDSIIKNPKTQWSGGVGEIHLGFDKSKPGAGGWLITGTPRMAPDYALEKIYGTKKYETQIKKQIKQDLQKAIDRHMGG